MKGWRKQLRGSGNLFASVLIIAGVAVIAVVPFISNPVFLHLLAILAGLAAAAGGILLIVHARRARREISLLAEPLQNEERLRLALEGAELGIFDWNILTGEQIVSREWYLMLGYAPGEVHANYEDWQARVYPEDLPATLRAIELHLKGLTPIYEAEYRLKTKTGEWKWVLARGQIVARGPKGEPLRMAGTHRDITERKEVGDTLQRRDAVLGVISVTAERLLTSTTWLEVLPELLAGLGQAIQASRAYVYEVYEPEPHDLFSRKLREWTAEGISPELTSVEGQGKSIRGDGYARWLDMLSAGQILQGKVSTFPPSELPNLLKLQVKSLIEVPIFTNSHWWGFIGFDDCLSERCWQPAEEDALKVAANVLSAAIQRQQLFEAEQEERRIAQAMLEMVTVLSRSLNYDSILDRLLEQVPRIVPFDGASVLLVRDNWAYVARQRGYEQDSEEAYLAMSRRSYDIWNIPNLAQLMKTQQVVITPDADEGLAPERGAVPVYRSWIGAPLILEGKVNAILSIEKLEPKFYTPVHAARLSLFASQASLALRNAQLFAETLQALEREQHLGEITRAISSALDLPVILQNVVRMAVELAGAEAGSMAILDDAEQQLSYPYLFNLPDELSEQPEAPGEGIAWELIYQRHPILTLNYPTHPHANPLWVAAGIHTCYGVPVIVGNKCLGALGVFSYNSDREFEPRDLALVEIVGRQTGVAIQNARLFEAAQRRAVEAETLRQAASAVNSALEIEPVLDKILEQLENVLPNDSSSVFLIEEDHVRMKAGRGLSNLSDLLAMHFSSQNPLFVDIDNQQAPVIIQDAQADPRFERWGDANYIHGWIGLQLRVREERIGYLTIDSRQIGAYGQADADLAQAYADEVAIALENARLFEEVHRLAITDPLTSLFNRRYFFDAARREFERARRYKTPLAIILIDLDHFKGVNDTYGHVAGDNVLVTVSSRCKQSLRDVDVPARYGGEEFIFLLPETDLSGAHLLAERLRERIKEQVIETGSLRIAVSASLGIAELDDTCPDLNTLVQHADQALYATKRTERGSITNWTPDLANI